MKLIIDVEKDYYEMLKYNVEHGQDYKPFEIIANGIPYEERPQGEYVPISKLRLMTVEECAGHTIDYALGWKACIEWIKKGGAEHEH